MDTDTAPQSVEEVVQHLRDGEKVEVPKGSFRMGKEDWENYLAFSCGLCVIVNDTGSGWHIS